MPPAPEPDEIVAALVEHLDRPAVRAPFEDFHREHAQLFAGAQPDEEHSLERQRAFERYALVVEEAVGDFLRLQGLGEEAFYARCRRGDPDGAISVVLAGLDFRDFVEMMCRQAAAAEQAEEDAELMGL